VLRSALTLSLLTGQAVEVRHIRAARSRPGLRPQHLTAVQAAAQISGARVDGDRVGSQEVSFVPGSLRPGDYVFDVGTAGPTTLVLQTLLLPLALAPAPSKLRIRGGTHVPWSPCFRYLDWQWRPVLRRIGVSFELRMTLAGFYPEGGGELWAQIPGGARVRALGLTEGGALRALRGLSAVANLPREIAERQRRQSLRRLARLYPGMAPEIEVAELPASSRGTLLLLLAERASGQGCCFALGARGKRAEQVADEAVDAVEAFLHTDASLDPCLADQLLLPLALAGEPSSVRTSAVTPHLLTNAAVIRRFLPVEIRVDGPIGAPATVQVMPTPRSGPGTAPQPHLVRAFSPS
jgi:RNA 3'-terminal phosphate cyclase (ATP)